MDNNANYPDFFQQIKNLSDLAAKVAQDFSEGKEIVAIEELQKQRMETCNSCDKYNSEEKRCTLCGCYMEYKTKIASATCPIMKW